MTNLKSQLKKTGRTLYVDDDVLKTALPTKSKSTLEFFKLKRYVSDDELEKEYTERGLAPATIPDLIAYDKENPEKMDEMQCVGTHWQDDGRWCYATFSGWHGGREVGVNRIDCGWGGGWSFAGLRKYSSQTLEPKPSSDPSNLELRIAALEKFKAQVEKVLKLNHD